MTRNTVSLRTLLTFMFPYASRAEKVVQRYRAARRFNIDRERIFSAYLTFGGIRTVRSPSPQASNYSVQPYFVCREC